MDVINPPSIDLLDVSGAPGLSSTNDMPVETKPDATSDAKVEDAPAVPPEQSGEVEQPAESATADTEEDPGPTDGEPRGVPKGVGKRLAELTRREEEAKARAEAAEQRLERMLGLFEQQMGASPEAAQQAQQAQGDPEPVEPSRAEYVDTDAYVEAVKRYADTKATWSARREVARLHAEQQEAARTNAIAQATRQAQEAYAARIETAKSKYADFKEVAERSDVQVSPAIAAAILHLDIGPELQYYFGKNPAEAKRISALSPIVQPYELGLLASKLTAPAVEAPKPKPAVSAAPAPIRPLTGSAAPLTKSIDQMDMSEYAAHRKSQGQSPRARH